MLDLMKMIADGRKVADDFQKGDWRTGVKDSLALLTEIESGIDSVFPSPPAPDPNAPPPLAAHAQLAAPLGATGLAAKIDEVCDDHEAQATKLGAGAAAGNHPLIQGFLKNILPLLIQALKFLPAA